MPWPRQACQFLIPHTTFIYTTNISKVSKGLRDVLLGYNLGFKSRIRPCKNYQREGNFFEKILVMKGSLKLLTKCQKSKKVDIIWYHLGKIPYIHEKRYYSTICLLKLTFILSYTYVLRNTHFQYVSFIQVHLYFFL